MTHTLFHTDFLTVYLACWLALLGAVIGSFLDCAAWRRAHGESVLRGRSHCGSCGHVLGARDLIPVFSYLCSRGRCRYCGAKIPGDALAAELAGAAVFAGCALKFGPAPELAMWLVFASILLLLSLIDHAQRVLPDGLLALAAANRLIFWLILERSPGQLAQMLIGACSVSVPLLFVVLIMDRVLGRETMGGGDIKLMFVLGLYLSWQEMILVLLAACVLGIAVGLSGLFARKREDGQRTAADSPHPQEKVSAQEHGDGQESSGPQEDAQGIAFGPCIAAAAALVLLFGQPVIDWYAGLLR